MSFQTVPSLVLLGRGPYFGRVLTVALLVALVAYPPLPGLSLHHLVGCEGVPLVAGVYFAGLQLLVGYWAVLRLRDAGVHPAWAFTTGMGALPGLLRAAGEPLAPALELAAYGLGMLATLGIGSLEPVAVSGPGLILRSESTLGRYWRRLMLPVVLLDVFVISPQAGAGAERALTEDGMKIAPVLMLAVEGHFRREGRWPDNNHAAGLPPPENISGNAVSLSGVTADGHIYIEYNHPDLPCAARWRRVELVPELVGDRINWQCRVDLPPTVMPGQCRSGVYEP